MAEACAPAPAPDPAGVSVGASSEAVCASAPLVFNGTSLMNRVMRKASRAMAAAIMKTSAMPWPYALSMTVRSGSGSLSMSGMASPEPEPPAAEA